MHSTSLRSRSGPRRKGVPFGLWREARGLAQRLGAPRPTLLIAGRNCSGGASPPRLPARHGAGGDGRAAEPMQSAPVGDDVSDAPARESCTQLLHRASSPGPATVGDRHVHRCPDGASDGVGCDSDSAATVATQIAATRIAATRIAATRIAANRIAAARIGVFGTGTRRIQSKQKPNVACERGPASWATQSRQGVAVSTRARATHTHG